MYTAITYAIISALGFGIANVVTKDVAVSLGAVRGAMVRSFVTVCVLLPLLVFTHAARTPTSADIFLGILLAGAGYLPYLFFVRGLEAGNVGVVVPVGSGRVLVSTLMGFAFLGEAMTGAKMLAVAIIFIGIVLASVSYDRKASALFASDGVAYAVLAALLWGIISPLYGPPSAAMGALPFACMVEFGVFAGALAHLMFLSARSSSPMFGAGALRHMRRHAPAIILAGAATGVGTTCINVGYETGIVSIVSALAAASVVVSLFVARVVYGEKLSAMQYGGAVSVVMGVVVAALF